MRWISRPAIGLLAILFGVLTVALVLQLTHAANESLPSPKINVSSTPINRQTVGSSFAPVIKKAAPSVVNIYSSRLIKAQDDPFRRFWGDGSSPRNRRPLQDYRAEGLGSGVIVSSDGYILTASHVIEGADDVRVALADGEKEIRVKVIGSDPATDIAVLKVDAKNLPAITLADSDKLEVGDVTLAIGNPFGVGQTVTMGIVSGLGRSGVGINGNNGFENFIQTDAAVNPGNSGGALVDAEGRLIGINTAIFSRSGGNEGVGFAVPANLAREMMDHILKDGKVMRGYLGVNMQSLTPDLAKEFKVPVQSGVLIGGVIPGTPAEKAGIKELDVVVEFNGKKIADSRQLRLNVAETRPQTKVTLKIIRAGAQKNLTAMLGELQDNSLVLTNDTATSTNKAAGDVLQGVTVVDLTPRLRRQFGIPSVGVQGAVVTTVDSDSTAAEAGLERGDLIMEVNHQPVISASQAIELSHKSANGRVLFRVWSRDEDGNGNLRFVVIQSGK